MNTTEVVKNGFCVGCGNCTFLDRSNYQLNENHLAELVGKFGDEVVDSVCPFSEYSESEDDIAKKDYENSDHFDPAIGFYNGIYAGWDNDESSRMRSSSGGLVTFLIEELIRRKLVDAAVVVIYDKLSPHGVKYEIIRDPLKLEVSRQSKYVVTSYFNVLDELEEIEGKYVFVGVPCYIKSIKLLMRKRSILRKRIAYTIAIFCGHQKTFSFPQYIGWNLGVKPTDLKMVNYRVKKKDFRSYEYFYQAVDSKDLLHESIVTEIKWLDWGVGLFKLKPCDICDDVTGETADIIFGDAWLRPYTLDHRGTNILVCRNRKLESILLESKKNGLITLIPETKEKMIKSQAAAYRTRKEGLLSRIAYFKSQGIPFPKRRASLFENFRENVKRRKVYVIRYELSKKSHAAFEHAKKAEDINVFFDDMNKIVTDYYRTVTTMKSILKGFLKKIVKRSFIDIAK